MAILLTRQAKLEEIYSVYQDGGFWAGLTDAQVDAIHTAAVDYKTNRQKSYLQSTVTTAQERITAMEATSEVNISK